MPFSNFLSCPGCSRISGSKPFHHESFGCRGDCSSASAVSVLLGSRVWFHRECREADSRLPLALRRFPVRPVVDIGCAREACSSLTGGSVLGAAVSWDMEKRKWFVRIFSSFAKVCPGTNDQMIAWDRCRWYQKLLINRKRYCVSVAYRDFPWQPHCTVWSTQEPWKWLRSSPHWIAPKV